ncbi:MAG: lysostaphin resistance A-like protein [Flavobacteriaceae bacterium]
MTLIALTLIPFQSALEELIFRGYLMQGFSKMLKNRYLPLIITSFIFGFLHFFNPEVDKLGNGIMFYYVGTGFFFGIITLMDEGTELAVGLHIANNLMTALLVTADWTAFQTESLYTDISEPSLGIELFIYLVIVYPVTLLYFSKKFNWSNWRKKLI